ncbi:hypothetical protein Acr_00g0057640 [Actinidia rufa]|uniref:Retrotransposon gag domain-containing protein n=1 Tax=Actinidia rufa TaxID=165716 RepID=A0A7J0DML2_9ERIC|nr:hypothetical protein Acr_00g0057640 [Actinidia rufa]
MQGVFTAIEQVVTRALDTILVTEEELRVLFASYQLQGDALQWWRTVEESVAKKWEPFRKAFLDQYFTDTTRESLRMEFINLVQGSMTVAQYEAKFTSLSRFAKAFVSTEEEKAKQFMRGLRPSIRNKLAGNLIKVYSTMVSAAAAIEETLNETRKITNPKSQREGTSNQFEGRFSKKLKSSTSQQQHLTRSSPITSAAASGQTSREGRLVWLSPARAPCYGLPTDRAVAAVTTEGAHKGRTIRELQDHNNILSQQGQRTQGRVYAMTSAARPSGTVGQ